MRVALLVLVVAILGVVAPACGKHTVSADVRWYTDADAAMAAAAAADKPLAVFVGATWDTAWKEIAHVTLPHPAVRARLARDFVVLYVDVSDDEDPKARAAVERFRIIGEPLIALFESDGATEITRIDTFVKPEVLTRVLDRAKRRS